MRCRASRRAHEVLGASVLVVLLAAPAALPVTPAYAHERAVGARADAARPTGSRATGARRARISRKRRAKPPRKAQAPLSPDATKALAAYEAMQKYFYLGSTNLYREEIGVNSNSFLWPFSQAIAATVSVAHIRGQAAKASFATGAELHGLQKYLSNAPPTAVSSTEALQALPHYTATIAAAGPGATTYYDDNDWVGIEMARLYELTHDEGALSLAEEILAFEQAGWSSSTTDACPGGIPHSDAESDENRSTISTAPAAELAVQLYRITGDAADLSFAESAYSWVRDCLLMPGNLFADHLEANGEVDEELWSYTQGVMIGAGALLYEATGNSGYLDQAQQTAEAAVSAWPLETLGAENPFFASVFLRNLIYLDSLLHNPTGVTLANEYVNWSWNSLHQGDGLFLSSDGSRTSLLEQAAVAQIYALLCTEPKTFF